MNEDLKPCPFCGSSPRSWDNLEREWCCSKEGCPASDWLVPAEVWNMRIVDTEIETLKEALRDAGAVLLIAASAGRDESLSLEDLRDLAEEQVMKIREILGIDSNQ